MRAPDRDSGGGRDRLWGRLRRRDDGDAGRPGPWRTEGMPEGSSGAPGQRPPLRGFWWWLIAALAVNWILMSVATEPPARTEVSYTFFSEQLESRNVDAVTSTADTIQGDRKSTRLNSSHANISYA